ncbi:hypothetical protein C0J52_02920 [Blattella germanica]|nr:hypothetical protein C0J52_02920 [Blattella germanica]
MNISLVNAYVIYFGFSGNPELTRLEYIRNLAKELVIPHLNRRFRNTRLPRELRLNISQILQIPVPYEARLEIDKQVRRRKCPPGSHRKTKKICNSCKMIICGGCTIPVTYVVTA